jgi:hypothetical protein
MDTRTIMEISQLSFKEALPSYEKHIQDYGQSVTGVMESPRFFYSIGAAVSGIPDVIIIGNIPSEVGIELVNSACRQLRTNGGRLGQYNNLLDEAIAYLLPCDDVTQLLEEGYAVRNELLFESTQYIRRLPVGTPHYAQLVLPDKHGKFPWEKGYDHVFEQPILSTYFSPTTL